MSSGHVYDAVHVTLLGNPSRTSIDVELMLNGKTEPVLEMENAFF